MESLEQILSEHPFFQDLDQRYVEFLVGCAANVHFRTGEMVCRSGMEANEFYLVRDGTLALEVVAPGHPPLIVETLTHGDILGWSWLVPPYHWNLDARAVEATRAIALDGRCLRAKCEADHDLGYELLKRFAQFIDRRLQSTRLQLLDVYGKRG